MPCVPTNIKLFAGTHETDDVIALAIFQIATEGDEERLWADGMPWWIAKLWMISALLMLIACVLR